MSLATQLRLGSQHRWVCLACRAIDPPTEPAYSCPECGQGATLSELGAELPKVCPWCGDGELEEVCVVACAVCKEGEVVEEDVNICDECGDVYFLDETHNCGEKPTKSEAPPEKVRWSLGADSKVASLRLECFAKQERVTGIVGIGGGCPGWQKAVQRYEAGDGNAFTACVKCALQVGEPGMLTAAKVEPFLHQKALNLKIE